MTSELWTRENLAWMAGIYEGEGYCQGRPRTYQRADGRDFTTTNFRLVISMSDEDIVTRFHKFAGIGTLRGPRTFPSRPNNKPLWDYSAHGADGYALGVAMWSWLGQRRKEQLHAAISAWLQAPGHWSKKKEQIKI